LRARGDGYEAEQSDMPVISELIHPQAEELRDWANLPDLASIENVNGLGLKATQALIQMLLGGEHFAVLKIWMMRYWANTEREAAITELREQLESSELTAALSLKKPRLELEGVVRIVD